MASQVIHHHLWWGRHQGNWEEYESWPVLVAQALKCRVFWALGFYFRFRWIGINMAWSHLCGTIWSSIIDFFSVHNIFHRQILGLTLCFNSQRPVNNFWWLRPILSLSKYDGDCFLFISMFIPSSIMGMDVWIIVGLFTVVYMYYVILFSGFYWG